MRALITRQRAATSAVLAASLAVLAACATTGKPGAHPSSDPSPQTSAAPVPPRVKYAPGTVLISDGTKTVTIGGRPVRFPTEVKDAVWSPDGSRIAFIDGDGKVAIARPDGTSLVRPASPFHTDRAERPTWFGSSILYTGWVGGTSQIIRVNAAGTQPQWESSADYNRFQSGGDWPEGSTALASASAEPTAWGGFLGHVAYEHAAAKGDEVWVLDYNQRDPYSSKVADGSEPAVSPDGKKVAFVGRNGQIAVAPTDSTDDGRRKITQVSFGAATPTHLVWTADGARIAYTTATGVASVAALPVGPKSNPAKQISAQPGVVSFLAGRTNRVAQFAGDPVAASIRASQSRWPTRKENYGMSEDVGPAGAVVIAATDHPEAALAASRFVSNAHGPLLFTGGHDLDPAVLAEVKRVLGKVRGDLLGAEPMVYLVGDVPAAAESKLRALGYVVAKFTGTPSELALAAMKQMQPQLDTSEVTVVDAADARTIALALANVNGFVLLAENGKLSPAARAYLQAAKDTTIWAIGDQARKAVPSTLRIAGPAATDTWFTSSTGFAQHYFGSSAQAVVAGGADPFAMAIAVSLARGGRAPLLMAGDSPEKYLDENAGVTDTVFLVGSVPDGLPDALSAAIS